MTKAGSGVGMSHGRHDCGGEPAGPIDVAPSDPTFWDLRVDAVYQLLADARRQILGADELRWMRESLTGEEYDRFSYYERWVAGIGKILLAKDVITSEELGRKMDEIRRRPHNT